jgi:hypothetical protein
VPAKSTRAPCARLDVREPQQEHPMRTSLSIRRAFHVAVAASGLALVPAVAFAQQPVAGVVVEAASRPDILRAERLEAQALLEEGKPSRWRDAAGLYRRAAELRGTTAEAALLHQRAAWLYDAVGEHAKGRAQLEQAARISLDHGDVVRAAGTLFDAALMAATGGDARATDATLERLAVLLRAPLMPADVRASIQARMAEPARLARR